MQELGRQNKSILVVEDEPAICQVCSRTFIGEGFEVDIAANGSLAEDILEKKKYDLILIDIRTPVMNGKQLYQSILRRHQDMVNGVIFTTGDVLGSDLKSFLDKSGRLFLAKPFTPDDLRNTVDKALGR
jgi:CheY-like chemotaxis protein